MFCQSQFFSRKGFTHQSHDYFTRKKFVQEGDEVTKSPKEATLVITGKSSVKNDGEKLFELTKSFLKIYLNQTIACRVLYHHWISDCLKNGKLMNMDEHNAPLVSKHTYSILLNFIAVQKNQSSIK